MSIPVFVWLGIAAVMVILELVSLGLTTIWFAGSALVAAVFAYFGAGWIAQLLVFAGVSIILWVFTRPVAQKHLMKETVKTNVESIPGMTGFVTEAINNVKNQGAVLVDGKEWTARSEDNSTIEQNQEIVVVSISGVKLIVKKITK